ncbi:hypothetical protein ASPCADRAFT_511351 [Aspergillus carbonarius ITEM 5010]|uniref:dihydrolipoyllysine-residue succinyltransferase n=1 Tax=Aspergillus carbonarius (strain ITEM 5010) TaxID=602072 RepID=A0A1R3S0R5_ASPC5|nr:hypothetical protein ASPCADRAFT_511351 [Aspergillus carbonarius ITEM 5010]
MLPRVAPRVRGTYAHLPCATRMTSSLHFPSQQTRPFNNSALNDEETRVISVPTMGESISEGILATFHKQIGDFVEQDEEIASIETDKIDIPVNASESGKVTKLLLSEGDTVTVGQAVVEMSLGKPEALHTELEPASESTDEANQHQIFSRPQPEPEPETKTQTMAKPEECTPAPAAPQKEEVTPEKREEPVPVTKRIRTETREKMTRLRLRIAERLKDSQNTAAFLTTFNEVDMSKVIEFRSRNKDDVLKKYHAKLGYMGLVARASALALKEIPIINASIENNDTIVFRDYIDLSIAVSTPKGLVTPVLRDMEDMGVVEIEKGIAELGKKARDNKLSLRDLLGGSFTISNSGIWGSLFGTPIINGPQTAVLGIYGIQQRPVAVNGQVEIRPMMYTALTYDHRLVDGREAVTFLTLVKKYLEDPASMLIE